MTFTNKLKPQIDLPVWEWCRFAPIVTQNASALATAGDGSDRFIYYIAGTSGFYRYDTHADTWQQLSTPVISVSVGSIVTMKYTKDRGYHGRILSATSTTVQIAGLRGPSLNNKTLKILSGTGMGQERVLTYTGETIHDMGVITATTTSTLTDNLKKWKFNQWSGYMVGITFGTGATQYKKILYNDTTTLYIADANLQPHDPWNNQVFVTTSTQAIPVVTAGLQAHFQILSHTYSVPAWTTTPDYTSYFTTLTGGVYFACPTNDIGIFYYDVLHDSWQTKSSLGNFLGSVGADSIEILSKTESAFLSSTSTSGSSRTLVDSVQTMTVDRYANYRILITGGTGIGQSRRIVCNTATTFTVERVWDINPNATSTYQIWGDYDKIFANTYQIGASMFAYSPEHDYWMQGNDFDNGIVNNIAVKMNGWKPIGVTSGTRLAAGVTAINSTPTAGGTGYLVGDILTCSVGGTGARVIVTSISAGGVVTGIELVASGTATGFTVGTGRATTGGTGTGCTIEITTVGVTCLITTATANWFKTGDVVVVSGCSEAAFNVSATILCVGGVTTFDIITTATANMAATTSQSTTVIVDSSKNWTVNEHVGKLVHLSIAGTAQSVINAQVRWITSNTATTLTVATITAGVNGTSKYVIYDSKIFGTDNQFKPANMQNWGHASSGSTTTLVDSSKKWIVNAWAGYKLRIEAGTGFASGIITITSNTATTLTYTTQSFTPDATTHYEIADTWGLMTAGSTTTITETSTKNWSVNMWAGKRVRITGGNIGNLEVNTISSNTATVLSTTIGSTPDATSTYAILGNPVKSTGIGLLWVSNNSDTATKGKYMFSPRGGASNTADIYDISTSRWVYGYFFSSQAETFTTGSMYAYDGVDTIYFQKDATGRIFSYNISTNAVNALGTIPYGHSTAIIGNRMEIVETSDGLTYLYIMRHSGQEMWRMLIFF